MMIEILQETLHYISGQNDMLNAFKLVIEEKEEKYKLMYSKICSLLLEEMEKNEEVVKSEEDEVPAQDDFLVKQEVCEEEEQNYPTSENTFDEASLVATINQIKLEDEERNDVDEESNGSDAASISAIPNKAENTNGTIPMIAESDNSFTHSHVSRQNDTSGLQGPRLITITENPGNSSSDFDKKFKCGYCQKLFSKKYTVKEHVKLVHTNSRPYPCKYCNVSFTLKGNLKSHTLLHTGEKPFKCSLCNKSCRRKVHLQIHMRRHHGLNSGKESLKCQYCDKQFTRKASYNGHVNSRCSKKPLPSNVGDPTQPASANQS